MEWKEWTRHFSRDQHWLIQKYQTRWDVYVKHFYKGIWGDWFCEWVLIGESIRSLTVAKQYVELLIENNPQAWEED